MRDDQWQQAFDAGRAEAEGAVEALWWIADRAAMLVGDEAEGWEDFIKVENYARTALAKYREGRR